MKKLTIVFLLITFTPSLKSQNLSIKETIEYINNSLIIGGKIEINNEGILTYTTLTKNYDLNIFLYYNYGADYTKDKQKMETKKSIFKIHISDINEIDLFDPNKNNKFNRKWGTGLPGTKYLQEWAIKIKCLKDEVHHIKKGDCISVLKNSYDSSKEYYTSEIIIRTKTGHKSSSEKTRNALLYLMDIIKDKSYYNKENDDDPFASKSFNENQFEIKSVNENGKIKLDSRNGVYYINITIGNITRKFILDSGASDVLISKELEKSLIERGFLKKENYLPEGLYKIADGSIIKCRRLLIPKLIIGEFTLFNVKATVNYSDTMLLGKSVLDKFTNWNIDNLNKTLKLTK